MLSGKRTCLITYTVKLVWTYSDRFKKGRINKNSLASHEYIQFLFRKSIKEAPSSYKKIVFTDLYNFPLFDDLDVELIPAPKKDFIFLDDLKFDAVEAINGEFIITDGDLFIKDKLTIPPDSKIGFECKLECEYTFKMKLLMQKEGIDKELEYWKGESKFINNLGLMYFNDDSLKNELIKEYRNTQLFFSLFVDKKYKINKKEVLFGSAGCCMFTHQFLESVEVKPFYFIDNNFDKFDHLGEKRKLSLVEHFNKINTKSPLI